MKTPEQRLWAVLGVLVALCLGLDLLFTYFKMSAWKHIFPWLMIPAVGWNNKVYQRAFESLSRNKRALFVAAVAVIDIGAIVFFNRGEASPAFMDVAEISMIIVLLLLYRLFSKGMDALWARFASR